MRFFASSAADPVLSATVGIAGRKQQRVGRKNGGLGPGMGGLPVLCLRRIFFNEGPKDAFNFSKFLLQVNFFFLNSTILEFGASFAFCGKRSVTRDFARIHLFEYAAESTSVRAYNFR